MNIFIASPLGFAESSRGFLVPLREKMEALGYKIIDPWSASPDLEEELQRAGAIDKREARAAEFHRISMRIAERNAQLLRSSDGVLAVLDGTDVDSGTASEIGYTFGLGNKVINGYRGDFRLSGENDGVCVNLQVQYWIEQSGGQIVTALDDLKILSFIR